MHNLPPPICCNFFGRWLQIDPNHRKICFFRKKPKFFRPSAVPLSLHPKVGHTFLVANGSQPQKVLRFREKTVIFSGLRPSHFPCLSASADFTSAPKCTLTPARFPQHLIPYSSSENQHVSRMAPWNLLSKLMQNRLKKKDFLVSVVGKHRCLGGPRRHQQKLKMAFIGA